MECESCNRWVHCECYGYKDSADRRVKEFHFCYKCLFEDDPQGYEEAIVLAKRRKVLRFILERDEVKQDESSNTSLAKELSMPQMELKEVIGALQQEKILYHRPNMKEHIWKVTKSARKLKTIQTRYFDPKLSKVGIDRESKSGTMSSYDDEPLSDTNEGHNSDTDYEGHVQSHFQSVYGSQEKLK